MKKLLGILGTITIAGSGMSGIVGNPPAPTEIKINSLQTNNLETLKRNKREINDNNEIDLSPKTENSRWKWEDIGTSRILITPNFWEELNQSLSQNQIKSKLKNKIQFINSKTLYGYDLLFYHKLSMMIKNNLNKINEKWEQSDKKHRIAIYYTDYSYILQPYDEDYASSIFKYNSVNILNNENILFNKYLDKLSNDFNNEINNNEINIGIIENENDDSILNAIKKKYIYLDIDQFEIKEIINYSQFIKGYFAKIKVKNNSEKYSKGILKPKFIFNTKAKVKELSDKIENNSLVKQWVEHMKDYNKNLQTNNLEKLTNNVKWSNKNLEKEIIKGYIRDFYQIITLIEHEWKLEELNNEIEEIKNNINVLKNTINDLEKRIINLENPSSSWNCANLTAIGGVGVSVVPVIGTIGSVVLGLISASCAIANA
ncbi:hypothetical protein [Spiroplasma endosymbiont of Lonchoptera lutea]|uniref:hypothetical protein n=1 Tax=Spiroplasma endosymbiont of Lonchoptera lutea TaxID=3066297 RepID=UPI0030D19F15